MIDSRSILQTMFDKLAIALMSPLVTVVVLGVLALIWLWVWSMPVATHALRGALEAQDSSLLARVSRTRSHIMRSMQADF